MCGACTVGHNRPDCRVKWTSPEWIRIDWISVVDREVLNHDSLTVIDIDSLSWSGEVQGRAIAIEHKIVSVGNLQVGPVIEHVIQRCG